MLVTTFILLVTAARNLNVGALTQDFYWRDYYFEDIPCDAIEAAPGRYIGQVYFQGDTIATIRPYNGTAVAEIYGRQNFTANTKIFCSNRPENFYWENVNFNQPNDGQMANVVRGGYQLDEGSQFNLYIGKAFHENEWKVGKVVENTHRWKGMWLWEQLMSGYLQLPLNPETSHKTALIAPEETGEFTRLPFGLVNFLYEFSRLIAIVSGELRNTLVVSYLDGASRKAKLKLNLGKCLFEIRYRPDETMSCVVCLSRAANEEPSKTEIMDELSEKRLNIFTVLTEEGNITTIQRSDGELSKIMKLFRKDQKELINGDKNVINTYELIQGRLHKRITIADQERKLYVIPDSMRKATVLTYHDQIGHFSVDVTIKNILVTSWFHGTRRKKPAMLHPISALRRPMERVHVDHLGPFVKSEKGNMYVLVITDALTKFTCLYPPKTTRSNEAIAAFKHFAGRFGFPKIDVSDRGTAFTSLEFQAFCQEKSIYHNKIASRWSQVNGQVERVNRTLTPLITLSSMKSEATWYTKLKET
ncbi:hypothetical protein Trydic_g1641 [Trypoxylus dichotomus]